MSLVDSKAAPAEVFDFPIAAPPPDIGDGSDMMCFSWDYIEDDGYDPAAAHGGGASKYVDVLQCFEEPPPPVDFILPGFAVRTVGSINSQGGLGKSYLALSIGCAVAGGVPKANLTGLEVKGQGRVLILAAEDPKEILWYRLYKLGRHLGPALWKEVAKNLDVMALAGVQPNLMDDGWFERVLLWAKEARLVIVDTLSRFRYDLDENSNRDMAQLMRRLEALADKSGAAVLFLHHVSKSAALAGLGDHQQAARGASCLIDDARFSMGLVGMTDKEAKEFGLDEEARRNYVRVVVTKQNYSRPQPDRWLKREEGGVLVSAKLVPGTARNFTQSATSCRAPKPTTANEYRRVRDGY